MNTFDTTTPDRTVRQCALTLHALNPQDRDWVLSQLAPAHRSQLQRLIAELQTLGIEPDAQLAGVATATSASSKAPAARDYTPQQLAAIVSGEPASLIALVTREHDAGFVEQLLAGLSPTARNAVAQRRRSASAAASVPPRLAATLRDEIDKRRPTLERAPSHKGRLAQRWRSRWRRIAGVLS
ncbi:hypothetical protein [Caenimonas koreensis]|uniref:hypothetical protein n=1 Tax=Caenimonas koreensis TaxID=367474 RepID=UPI0037846BBF